MAIVQHNRKKFTVRELCKTLGVSRATWYYRQKPRVNPDRRKPPRRLTESEKAEVLDIMNSERFRDQSPAAIYAQLLDDGRYICSIRSMYRILKAQNLVHQRRHQREHPVYKKPELMATGPNQVWSWDITRIKGSKSWIYYELYVVIDIFSRYVVAWTISERESGEQAKALIETACNWQRVKADQLTIHSDRGKSMRSKCLADLYGELGIIRSFNRPHVSNDNPFSESHFKTMKYRPDYPERFGSIEDARAHMRRFFDWYNIEHRHSGIAMMTPKEVHTGRDKEVQQKRQSVLDAAYAAHPERFVRGNPKATAVPEEVWINKPAA